MTGVGAWTPAHWTAAAACVTALVSVLAALFAFFQVREARTLREAQAQPFVVADFDMSPASTVVLDLVLSNVGKTVAKDVHVSFEPPLESAYFEKDEYDISQAVILNKGIPTMPPGKVFRLLFDRGPDRHASDLPTVYDVTVRFSNYRGRAQEPLIYRLDLNILFGWRFVGLLGVHQGVKALEDIAKLLRDR